MTKASVEYFVQYKEYADKPAATVPKPAELSDTGGDRLTATNDFKKETPPMTQASLRPSNRNRK